MTIEIKELVIKASVSKAEDTSGQTSLEGNTSGGAIDEQKIVRSCVEQVLEILKREKER